MFSFSCAGYLFITDIFPSKWRTDQCFCVFMLCVFLFMCSIPFDCSHIPDQAVFFVNSCLIKMCKVVIFCRGCINMRLGLSRWTVDVQPDKIGRAYKNKGRLHIPQFHKSGFTLRRASSVDTYCTE